MIVVQTRTSASPAANVDHHPLELALGHLAVADDEPRARAAAAAAARPGPRSSRPGCGRRRPGRRGRARAGSRRGRGRPTPRRRASGSAADPRAASRSRSCRGRRRAPGSASAGSASRDRVRTSTSRRSCLRRSLAATPKRCSSSTTTRPRSRNRTSLLRQPMGPDDEVDRAVREARRSSPPARAGSTNRDRSRTFSGNAANRWLNVWWCWAASTVVGTRTATCLPSWIALNAARRATSVLP